MDETSFKLTPDAKSIHFQKLGGGGTVEKTGWVITILPKPLSQVRTLPPKTKPPPVSSVNLDEPGTTLKSGDNGAGTMNRSCNATNKRPTEQLCKSGQKL